MLRYRYFYGRSTRRVTWPRDGVTWPGLLQHWPTLQFGAAPSMLSPPGEWGGGRALRHSLLGEEPTVYVHIALAVLSCQLEVYAGAARGFTEADGARVRFEPAEYRVT